MARALASNPRLLLLDEPFGALDAVVRKQLRQGLREIVRSVGVTTIIVTHDQEEAFDLADKVGAEGAEISTKRRTCEAPLNACWQVGLRSLRPRGCAGGRGRGKGGQGGKLHEQGFDIVRAGATVRQGAGWEGGRRLEICTTG